MASQSYWILLALALAMLGRVSAQTNEAIPIEGPVKQVVAAPTGIYSFNSENRISFSPVVSEGVTTPWRRLDWEDIRSLHVTPAGSLWAVDTSDRVLRRVGITEENPLGETWEAVPGPSFHHISAGPAGVCGVDLHGHIYCLEGTYGDPVPSRVLGTWHLNLQQFPEARKIVVGHDKVYVVDRFFSVHESVLTATRHLLDFERVGWEGLSQISSSPSGQLFSISTLDGAVYESYRPVIGEEQAWRRVSDLAIKHISTSSVGVWAIDPKGRLYFLRGSFGDDPANAGSFREFVPLFN